MIAIILLTQFNLQAQVIYRYCTFTACIILLSNYNMQNLFIQRKVYYFFKSQSILKLFHVTYLMKIIFFCVFII